MSESQLHLLARLKTDVQSVGIETRTLTETLADEQLVWSPGPRQWSIGQCFEHLRRVDRAYLRQMGRVLETASADEPRRPFRPSLLGQLFLWGTTPELRLPVPAPPKMRPKKLTAAQARRAVKGFLDQLPQVEALIDGAQAVDLNGVRFQSPLSRLVWFRLGDGLVILVSHQQRHVRQAQRVAQARGFPA